jgi:acetyl esterase
MTLTPCAAAMLAAFADAPALDFSTMTAVEFRESFVPPQSDGPAVAKVVDLVIDVTGRELAIRLYHPFVQGKVPITLYLHGGGFVIGDLDMTDAICRGLALSSGGMVASVDYRLSPETPFPGGLQDAIAALEWVYANAEEIGGRADLIAVAGDSSGANFAAVLAQRSRHAGPAVCHQLLFYPVLDARCDTDSYRRYASGYLLTADMMRWYWSQYLTREAPREAQDDDAQVSPARQRDLRGVPAGTIHVAEYDVLRGEAERYAADLTAAGVDVELVRWPGQIHGFLLRQGSDPDADAAIVQGGEALKAAFCRDAELPRDGAAGP